MVRKLTDRGWSKWWPFAALCAVVASRWMLVNIRSEAVSTVASQAAGCGMAACLCFLNLLRHRKAELWSSTGARAALSGAMLLCGPAIALVMGARVDPIAVVMALSLTPVAAGVAQTALGEKSSGNLAGSVWPGLAAVAGLLLLLAQPSFSRFEVVAALLLAPLLTGVGASVFRVGKESGTGVSLQKVGALSGAAVVFAIGILIVRLRGGAATASGLAAAADALMAWLSVTALERVGTTRWTAQFTLVPLIFLLEGILLMRPILNARSLTGLGLLLLASLFLLIPSTEEDA